MNPRILFFILIFSGLFHVPGLGQRLETKYPRTVETTSDSFSISFSNYPQWVNRYRVGNPDTIGPGTDGAVGLYAKIYSGKDSTRIDYTNMPYEQVNWINIESPKGKTVFRLHFNQVNAAFSLDYIRKHRGTLEFEVPEVFELANIIWTLSPAGQRADNLHKEGNYFQAVRDYFKPFLDHPLFKNLDMDADHATLRCLCGQCRTAPIMSELSIFCS